MAVELLVDSVKREAKTLVTALSKRKIPFDAVFWYRRPEEQKWKLVIESPWVNEKGPWQAYRRLIDVVRDITSEDPAFTLDSTDIQLVKRGDSLAKRFHQAAKQGMITAEGPFTGPTPAGFVEDSYVYWVKELEGGTRRGAREPVH